MAILTRPAAKGAKPDYTCQGEWRNGIPAFSPQTGDQAMNSMGASQRKKGIRLIGTAVGFVMMPVLAVAQTAAVTTSGPSAAPAGPVEHFYYGPGMMGGWGPGYYGPGMMGGFGLFWELLWLLIIVGIVLGMAFLIRGAFTCRHRQGCGSGRSDNGNAALKLLDARYARGEIKRDEYLEKRSDLEK